MAKPGEFDHTYRLGGPTCLAGDVIGDYSFKEPLKIGDKLVFNDMALYTMVKTNTFNGMPLPNIYLGHAFAPVKTVRELGMRILKADCKIKAPTQQSVGAFCFSPYSVL